MWRGPPLADFAYEQFAQPEIARLAELRLLTLEERIEADLALGRHAALVPELETLVREHPARERLRAQLMLALYRSGRQADALASYQDARRAFADQLGLEPSRELQALEQSILGRTRRSTRRSDAGRRSRPTVQPRRRPDRGRRRDSAGRGRGGDLRRGRRGVRSRARDRQLAGRDRPRVQPVGRHHPDRRAAGRRGGRRRIHLGREPRRRHGHADRAARQEGRQHDLSRRERGRARGRPARRLGGGHPPDQGREARSRLSLRGALGTDRAGFRRIRPAGHEPHGDRLRRGLDRAHVWRRGAGRRTSHEVTGTISVGNDPSAIATGAGGVWVTDAEDNTVTRIDPASEGAVVATTSVGQGPTALAVGGGAVWVANTQDGTVSRIDPRTATVTHTIPVGRRPTGVAAGAGAVWVANSLSGTLDRIDPHTMRVESTVEVGAAPQGVTVAHGLVWVSVQRRAPAGGSSDGRAGWHGAARGHRRQRDNRPRARGGPPAHRGHVRDALQLPGPALPGRGDAPAGGGERAAVHLLRRAHVHVQDP